MAHKTLVNGTAYDVKGGKALVNGTGYDVKNGKTLVNGTGYTIKFGTPISELAIGSTIYMNVDGNRVPFTIVHKGNPDASIYDSSCDGVWVWGNHITSTTGTWYWPYNPQYSSSKAISWNFWTTNEYDKSTINTWLNNDFLWKLDSGIRSQIKSVKIPYYKNYNVLSGNNGLQCKVFFMDPVEYGWTFSDAAGAKLDYFPYGAANVDTDGKRICYWYGTDGAQYPADWWTRKPAKSSTNELAYEQLSEGRFIPSRKGATAYSYATPVMIFDDNTSVNENYDIISSGSDPIVLDNETWIFNNNINNYVSLDSNYIFPVGFTSNGERAIGIFTTYYDGSYIGISYGFNESRTTTRESYRVYSSENSSWYNQSYRTITLDYKATGNLLTWLSKVATKQ